MEFLSNLSHAIRENTIENTMTLQAAKNTGVLGSRNNVFGIGDISRKSTSLPHVFREFFSEFWLPKISQAQGAALGQKSGYGIEGCGIDPPSCFVRRNRIFEKRRVANTLTMKSEFRDLTHKASAVISAI